VFLRVIHASIASVVRETRGQAVGVGRRRRASAVPVACDKAASIPPFGVQFPLDGGRHCFGFHLSIFWARLITANRPGIYPRKCNFEHAQGMWKLNLERQRRVEIFLSLASRIECMAAASCVRSLLISSVRRLRPTKPWERGQSHGMPRYAALWPSRFNAKGSDVEWVGGAW